MKAVAYCRYSSENQRQESIEAQIRAIEEYVKKEGITLIEIYADEAKSATSDKRPAFQKMIKDADNGAFEMVIVHKLDRFARDRYDSIFYRRKLKNHGVKLVSVTEKLDGSPESVILESMLEGISEYYSRNLSRESMKGLMENVYKGKTTGGKPAFGYDIDPITKEYVLNEKEAYAVAKVFADYAEGKSYNDIKDWLNANGFQTKHNTHFKKNSIHFLLKNEKYTGVYVFNKSSRSKYEYGQREEIRLEGGVPAIISKETFEIVQRRLAINKKSSQVFKAKDLYVLSGKVVCGVCGSKMFGNRRTSGKGSEWSGYLCSGRKKKICRAPEVKKDTLESLVINHLEKEMFTDDYIDYLTGEIIKAYNSSLSETQVEMDIMKDNLKRIDKQIENIMTAIVDGFSSPLLKIKMESLEIERANTVLNIEVEEFKSQKKLTVGEIKKYLSKGKGISSASVMDQMSILNQFLDKVVVYEDYIDIHFYINNPKKETWIHWCAQPVLVCIHVDMLSSDRQPTHLSNTRMPS